MLSAPPEGFQVATLGSLAAGLFVPWAPTGSQPMDDSELPARGRKGACLGIWNQLSSFAVRIRCRRGAFATYARRPDVLEDVHMTAACRRRNGPGVPWCGCRVLSAGRVQLGEGARVLIQRLRRPCDSIPRAGAQCKAASSCSVVAAEVLIRAGGVPMAGGGSKEAVVAAVGRNRTRGRQRWGRRGRVSQAAGKIWRLQRLCGAGWRRHVRGRALTTAGHLHLDESSA